METKKIKNKKAETGFTLLEIVIVAAILIIFASIVIPNFGPIKEQLDIDNSAKEIAAVLKLAQSRTLALENNSQYGVYFNATTLPNQYILFKGESYEERDTSADQFYFLPERTEFSEINLVRESDGNSANETVFSRLTGASQESGSISVALKTDETKNGTVYITTAGAIGFNPPSTPDDTNRIKDSRHIQFDYNRLIDAINENIILDFENGAATEIIPISQNLASGELYWQGTVNVNGTDQTIHIYTNRLNNPDTQFNIKRDRRYNTAGLKITISGDSSGYLADYSADGLTTNFLSIYVNNFSWQ